MFNFGFLSRMKSTSRIRRRTAAEARGLKFRGSLWHVYQRSYSKCAIKNMVQCSFKSHNSSKVCAKSLQWYPLSTVFFFWLLLHTFRGITGQTNRVYSKTSQQIHCIVLKKQLDMCVLTKMHNWICVSWQKCTSCIGTELTKSISSVGLPLWVVRFRSRVKMQVKFLAVIFLPDVIIFSYSFSGKAINYRLIQCNKKDTLWCLFNRKLAFISLSSLAWGKSLILYACTRSFARANDAKSYVEGTRNAMLK